MLNKKIGCESRTVPPLYVLTGKIIGESRSLGKPGKADLFCAKALSMSQKTYALVRNMPAGLRERVLLQKNGCGTNFGAAAYLRLEEEKV